MASLDAPAARSPLIGRDVEVARVIELLERPDGRVLTITGPGGCGKTRLALEVTRRMSERLADGALFVGLAPVRDPFLVASEIARTLGVPDQSGTKPDAGPGRGRVRAEPGHVSASSRPETAGNR